MKRYICALGLSSLILLTGCNPKPIQPEQQSSSSSTQEIIKSNPKVLSYSQGTLALESSSMRIARGETAQIVISQCPVGYEDKLIFVSSNPKFATVDADGFVTGVSSGAVTVNVSVHGAAVYQTIMIYIS